MDRPQPIGAVLRTSPGALPTADSSASSTPLTASDLDVMLKLAGLPLRLTLAEAGSLPPDMRLLLLTSSMALLSGLPGRGKSWAAAAWLRERMPGCVERRPARVGEYEVVNRWTFTLDAAWLFVPAWLHHLRRSFAGENVQGLISVDRACCVSVLVLDDLGSQADKEWATDSLYTVIAERDSNTLPTVVTTNLDLEALHAWHPRLASRLAGWTRIAFPGPDRRITP